MISLRFRRLLVSFLAVVAVFLVSVLIIFPSPDLSEEKRLLRRIAELQVRVQDAELFNLARKKDLQNLYRELSNLIVRTNSNLDKKNKTNRNGNNNLVESEALFRHSNWSYDLSLPSIHHSLPHTVNHPDSFVPALKIAKGSRRGLVSVVLGIPTVKRDHQSYLLSTLKSIVDNLTPEEMEDCLIIVFIAEYSDSEFVRSTARDIESQYNTFVINGLIEIIAPPKEYYPDFSSLRLTLGDDLERVQWRTKQNLDFAFLMMYAQWRGTFYVQLEDDILTKPGFLTTMKDFALDKIASKEENWFVIDFCQLGFIGKMFRSTQLPVLIQFFLMFYNDKPVDWLLENVIQTKVCKLDQDYKKCKKEKAALWIHYKPSLFQHIGTHSSLKGKVQRLKDKQFGKVQLFVPHKNPSVIIETNIKHYKHYSITRAYRGETFYWGLAPQAGDKIEFSLSPPIMLKSVKFVSGNLEHPSDRFINTSVDVLAANSKDGYVKVAEFDSNGIAEGILGDSWGPIRKVRLSIHSSSDNWAILSEIYLQAFSD